MFNTIDKYINGMKKIARNYICMAFVMTTLLLLFSGCSNGSVSDAMIKSDLEKSRFVENGIINSNYVSESSYELTEYTIVKRKTDKQDGRDDVYCQATISNGYIESQFECLLKYTYYDKGGWILDSCNLIDSKNYPVVSPNKEIFEDINIEVKGKKIQLTNDQINKIELSTEESDEGIKYFAVLEYKYADEKFSLTGTLPIEFDSSEGWQNIIVDDFAITDFSINWESPDISKSQNWSVDGWLYSDTDGKKYSISNVYYVDKNKKNDVYSWHILYIIPWFNAELQIDEFAVRDSQISGKIIIEEKEPIGDEYSLQNKKIEIPFTSSFDKQSGEFKVTKTIDALSYIVTQPYALYRRRTDGLTVPVDLEFTLKYSLSSNDWSLENRISKINVDADDYLTLFDHGLYDAANVERDRLRG